MNTKKLRRALETDCEVEIRREQDRIRTAKRRALETPAKQDKHREQDKIHRAQMRALLSRSHYSIWTVPTILGRLLIECEPTGPFLTEPFYNGTAKVAVPKRSYCTM